MLGVDTILKARFYQMHLVLDSEPICAIFAVSHIQFLGSEKLHISKSNSLEAACELLKIEVSRPEVVILGRPIYNHLEVSVPRRCRSTTV